SQSSSSQSSSSQSSSSSSSSSPSSPAAGASGFTGLAFWPDGVGLDVGSLDGEPEGDGLTTMGSPRSGLEDAIKILGPNTPPATASTMAAITITRESLIGPIFHTAG